MATCLPRYPFTLSIQTRWNDNDQYGHVNNAVFYQYMDTAVNAYLIQQGAIIPGTTPVIGLCVKSSCSYYAPLEYPDVVGECRLRPTNAR